MLWKNVLFSKDKPLASSHVSAVLLSRHLHVRFLDTSVSLFESKGLCLSNREKINENRVQWTEIKIFLDSERRKKMFPFSIRASSEPRLPSVQTCDTCC